MNYFRLAVIGVLLGLIVFGYVIFNMWQSERSERMRQQQNVKSLLNNQKEGFDVVLRLTKKELLNYNTQLVKEIIDTLNIRPKQITNITTHKHTHIYDTTIIELKPTLSDSLFTFSEKLDSCLSINGRVDMKNEKLYLDNTLLNYNSKTITYWEKTRKIWFIKYHKELFQKSYNNCKGKTEIKKIEIINKP